jgi:hypothetical protein
MVSIFCMLQTVVELEYAFTVGKDGFEGLLYVPLVPHGAWGCLIIMTHAQPQATPPKTTLNVT